MPVPRQPTGAGRFGRRSRWRLESFDLRAGLAFTTFRAPQVECSAVDEWPCFFIAPPTFALEPVSSIATALAAQHGSCEGLLLVDGVEAGFATPEEVAAFVRRAYLASGGGDGADGDPGPDEPLPPPGDMPPPRGTEPSEPGPAAPMVRSMTEFQSMSKAVSAGESFTFGWNGLSAEDAAAAARNGVDLVLKTLLERVPRTPGAGAARWAIDLWALLCTANQRALWSPSHQDTLQMAVLHGGPSPAFESLTGVLRWPGHSPQPMGVHEWLEALQWGWISLPSWLGWDRTSLEPVQALRRWPVPVSVAKGLPADLGFRASLFHLLNVFCAAPAQWQPGRSSEDCLALAIFAATCLLPPQSLPGFGASPPVPPGLWYHHGPAREGAQASAKLAVDWLCRQLPARGFQQGLEERIGQAMHLRYVGPKATGATAS